MHPHRFYRSVPPSLSRSTRGPQQRSTSSPSSSPVAPLKGSIAESCSLQPGRGQTSSPSLDLYFDEKRLQRRSIDILGEEAPPFDDLQTPTSSSRCRSTPRHGHLHRDMHRVVNDDEPSTSIKGVQRVTPVNPTAQHVVDVESEDQLPPLSITQCHPLAVSPTAPRHPRGTAAPPEAKGACGNSSEHSTSMMKRSERQPWP